MADLDGSTLEQRAPGWRLNWGTVMTRRVSATREPTPDRIFSWRLSAFVARAKGQQGIIIVVGSLDQAENNIRIKVGTALASAMIPDPIYKVLNDDEDTLRKLVIDMGSHLLYVYTGEVARSAGALVGYSFTPAPAPEPQWTTVEQA